MNFTREKLTDFEGKYETKKLVVKKYYEEKKEIEKFKQEKENMNKEIIELRGKNNELELKVIKFKKTMEDYQKKLNKKFEANK